MNPAEACWQRVLQAATAPYRQADAHAHRFARAKLGGDRVFRQVLEQGLVAPGARVLDLGCGQGLLASLLRAAGEFANEFANEMANEVANEGDDRNTGSTVGAIQRPAQPPSRASQSVQWPSRSPTTSPMQSTSPSPSQWPLHSPSPSQWPPQWPPAPRGAHVTGIDPLPRDIQRAVIALGPAATFVQGDMRSAELPPCDVAVCFDTLHYIAPHEQDAVLARVCQALAPGGMLLMRVHDTAAPLRYAFGRWVDRATMLLHGGGFGRVAGRPLADWTATLQGLGFEVAWQPMHGRPPFANLLIVARRPLGAKARVPPSNADRRRA